MKLNDRIYRIVFLLPLAVVMAVSVPADSHAVQQQASATPVIRMTIKPGQSIKSLGPIESVQPLQANRRFERHDRLIAIWPVAGSSRLSSQFGKRKHPLRNSMVMHSGIDLAAPRGTPVLAVSAGTVTFAGWRNGYGRTIEVLHADGWMTRYAHAQNMTVKQGDHVLQGQSIAQVGSSGDVTGPHLHLEVWKGDQAINPLSLYPEGYAYVMQQP